MYACGCMEHHTGSQSYEVCPRGQTNLHQAKKRTSQSSGVPVLVPEMAAGCGSYTSKLSCPLLISERRLSVAPSLPLTSVQVSCCALCYCAWGQLSRENHAQSLLLVMYEGETDHCHSISAIFNLISSQNFICQLNHCRQTLQRWKVGGKKSRKQTKEGPFVALRIFYLFLSSVYLNISYMPKLRLKKMTNVCSIVIKHWLQRTGFVKFFQ